MERKAKDMKQFVEDQMTNYSERITFGATDLNKAIGKANKFGLPLAILFTSKPRTAPMTKFLSTELRRRMLIAEVPPTTNNKKLMQQFGISSASDKDSLPLLVVFPSPEDGSGMIPSADAIGGDHAAIIRYEEKEFSQRKIHKFLSKHALSEPVYKARDDEAEKLGKASAEEQATESDSKRNKPQHVEL
mmetsp:Transcript_14427/g.40979  ORF Transcript_14427/g.40979 Transcript_14427/m.40979 type:complete len:189 (+) Transcript_14427:443-1009(+)